MGRTLIEIQNGEQVRVNEKKEYNETRSASPVLNKAIIKVDVN